MLPLASPPVTELELTTDDLEAFARRLGLAGQDADLFYEVYYSLDNGEFERELEAEYIELCDTGA